MAIHWHQLIDPTISHLHLNPALNDSLKDHIQTVVSQHQSSNPLHWIMSSGTTSTSINSFKLIGLSHQALLASAQAANVHLQVGSKDVWLNLLPLFHVGGLGVLYRSTLAGNKCFNLWSPGFKWNPEGFLTVCQKQAITLTSLVPTQVYDLVQANLTAPACLRAIVVGGARLAPELYHSARQLGWPLLPSFGMTEAASQIATASLESLEKNDDVPSLNLLSHISARCDEQEILSISGPSLLDGYYLFSEMTSPQWIDPKDHNGWYRTQDRAQIHNKQLTILARIDDVIKVRGEIVNLATLRQRVETLKLHLRIQPECTLVAVPDARLGHKIVLVGETNKDCFNDLINQFNQSVLPFERIESYSGPIAIPKNSMGKIQHQALVQSLLASR